MRTFFFLSDFSSKERIMNKVFSRLRVHFRGQAEVKGEGMLVNISSLAHNRLAV